MRQAQVQPPHAEDFKHGMDSLVRAIRTNDAVEVRRTLSRMIPEAMLAVPVQTNPALRALRLERKSGNRPPAELDKAPVEAKARLTVS